MTCLKFGASWVLPPGIFIVIFFALAWYAWRRRERRLAACLAGVTFVFYLLCTGLVAEKTLGSLEQAYLPPAEPKGDVIIMLGGGAMPDSPDVDGVGALCSSPANRLLTAVRLQRKLGVPILLSGGQVYEDTGAEAKIARRMLIDLGVPEDQILVETRSINTTQNARYSAEILREHSFTQPILVTSAFHMKRAVLRVPLYEAAPADGGAAQQCDGAAGDAADTGDEVSGMTKNLTEGEPARLILFFTLPLIAGNIFQQLYAFVDTLLVGRFLGVDALAAVGSTGPLMFLMLGFVIGFSTGLSIYTGQRFGARDEEGVRRSVAACAVLSLAASIVLTAIGVFFCRQFLLWMQTPAEILEGAYSFISLVYAGICLFVFYQTQTNLVRALGDSKTPTILLAAGLSLNIIFEPIAILVLGWGIPASCAACPRCTRVFPTGGRISRSTGRICASRCRWDFSRASSRSAPSSCRSRSTISGRRRSPPMPPRRRSSPSR